MYAALLQIFGFLHWQDYIEIILLSCIVYFFSLWLKQDRQQPLVLYFYTYCLFLFVCHEGELTTLSHFMLVCSPAIIVLFFTIHQRTLQRNFITLKNIVPPHNLRHDKWFDDLIRTALTSLHSGKDLVLVVERHDSLSQFLEADIRVDVQLNKKLFDILLETPERSSSDIVWINHTGQIIGINAHWKAELIDDTFIPHNTFALTHASYYEHVWFSSKTDAFILHLCATKKQATLIMQEKIIKHLSPVNGLNMLRDNLLSLAHAKKGLSHDYQYKKYSHHQPNS